MSMKKQTKQARSQEKVEVLGSLLHNAALHDPERLDDPRFFEEVCDLIGRYILK